MGAESLPRQRFSSSVQGPELPQGGGRDEASIINVLQAGGEKSPNTLVAFRKKEREAEGKKALSFKQVARLFVICKMRRWKSMKGQRSLRLTQGIRASDVCAKAPGLSPAVISFFFNKNRELSLGWIFHLAQGFQTWPRWSLNAMFHPHSPPPKVKKSALCSAREESTQNQTTRLLHHWNPHSRDSRWERHVV